MRPLATNEKRLFLLLCGAVFIALNMLGLRSFVQARTGLRNAVIKAKAEFSADRELLDLGVTLRPGHDWIEKHPMPSLPADEASAGLLKLERDEAEKAGLKVLEENLLPAEEGNFGSSVSVAAKLSGPFPGVVRMLFALQTPTEWISVEKLALRSDSEPPNVVAELELKRYFHSIGPESKSPHPAAP